MYTVLRFVKTNKIFQKNKQFQKIKILYINVRVNEGKGKTKDK